MRDRIPLRQSRELRRAALGFIRERGHGYACLLSEEFRLPVIKTYLRLGFEPEMLDATQPRRWERLRWLLAAGGQPDTASAHLHSREAPNGP